MKMSPTKVGALIVGFTLLGANLAFAGDFYRHDRRVPGQYVVVLNKGYAAEEMAPYVVQKYGGSAPKKDYFNRLGLSKAPVGFAWYFESSENGDRAAEQLASEKFVSFVEMVVTSKPHDTMFEGAFTPSSLYPTTSLGRMDSLSYKLDGRTGFTHTGEGTVIYVLDDAADTSHPQFGNLYGQAGSRVSNWRDATLAVGTPPEFNITDSHGTAMAACAAGTSFGSARRASVRVIDVRSASSVGGGFEPSNIERAVNYILADYGAGQEPMVVSVSFGLDETFIAVRQQFERLTAAGIPLVVSAGNDTAEAGRFTPADILSAVTVGNANGLGVGSNPFSPIAPSFDSNYGDRVDIYAAAESVPTALTGGAHSSGRGTSQAAAYTAGVVATLLEAWGRRADPSEVATALTAASGRLTTQPRAATTDRLLFTDFLGPKKLEVRGGLDSTAADSIVKVERVPGGTDVVYSGLTRGQPATYFGCGLPSEVFDSGSIGYVRRTNSQGVILWTREIAPARVSGCQRPIGDSSPVDIAIDGSSVFVVVHDSYLNFLNPSAIYLGRVRAFELALSTGQVLQQWTLLGPDSAVPNSTVPRSIQSFLGNVFVVGSSSDLGFSSFGGSDVFAAKLLPAGRVSTTWWGTAGNDVVYGVVPSASGGLVFGATDGVWPGGASAGGFDAFVQNISNYSMPTLVGTRQLGTAGSDSFNAAVQISYGMANTPGYLLVGVVSGPLSGVAVRGSQGGSDVVIATYEQSGQSLIPRQVLATPDDESSPLVSTSGATDAIFVGFRTYGSFAGSNPGGSDFVISKYLFHDQLRSHWDYQSRGAGDEILNDLSAQPFQTSAVQFQPSRLIAVGSSSGSFRPSPVGGVDGFFGLYVAD